MKREYFILSVICLIVFSIGLGIGIITPFLPSYARDMGATGFLIGLIFSGIAIVRILMTPFVGRIADVFKKLKNLIVFGLFIYLFAPIIFIYAKNPSHLLIARLFQGIGASFIFPISLAAIGHIAPRGKEGSFSSLYAGSFFLGNGLGPFMGGVISDKLGTSHAFWILFFVVFLSFLFALFLFKEPAELKLPPVLPPFYKIFKDKTMSGIVIFRFGIAYTRGLFLSFFPLLAVHLGASKSLIGVIFVFQTFSLAISQYPSGKFIDKLKNPERILPFAMIIAIIVILLHLFFKDPYKLIPLHIIYGLGTGFVFPTTISVATKKGEKLGIGSTTSLISSAFSAGLLAGPVLSGIFYDLTGIYGAFISCIIFAFIILILTSWIFFKDG